MKKLLTVLAIFLFPAFMQVDAQCYTPDVQQSAVILTASGATSIGEAEFTLGKDAEGKPKKVRFVLGNLQYNYRQDIWRIAPRQYDYVGGGFNGHKKYPDSDLFDGEYGTIYDEGGVKCWNPKSETERTQQHYNEWVDLFTFDEGNSHSDVIDGMTVRTPTEDEFEYLVQIRANHEKLCARGRIILDEETPHHNTFVNGLILLPDDWDPKVFPAGKTIIPDLDGINGCWYYNENILTEGEWRLLEAQGAIFLPAAGTPIGKDNAKYNRSGFYWTATTDKQNSDQGRTLEFGGYPYGNGRDNYTPEILSQFKTYKRAFRLCQDVEVEVEEEAEEE